MKKHILEAVHTSIRLCRGRLTLARELVDSVSKIVGKPVSSQRISKYLKILVEKGLVERERINPLHTLNKYSSLEDPGCCRYSEYSQDVNPEMCVACGVRWIK